MSVSSKRQMYALYEAGAFGNKLRTWPDVASLLDSDYAGTVSLRYAGSAGGGWSAYDVPVHEVERVVSGWFAEGADRDLVKVNESAPDSRLTLQGEVAEMPGGLVVGDDRGRRGTLVLRYSTWKGKMRDAMRHSTHVTGALAIAVLRDYLTGASYDDIRDLLDIYTGAVVEFSAYAMTLGDCRGRNAVIWEVRSY